MNLLVGIFNDQEKRIKKLEKFVFHQKKTHLRLYNRYYARVLRRKDADRRMLAYTRRRANIFSGLTKMDLMRLAAIVRGLRRDRHIVLLSSQEKDLLRLILKRRTIFSPRKIHLPIEYGKTS